VSTRALEAASDGAAAAPIAGRARLKRRAGRWALRGLAALVFFFIFIPVVFVLWISLFQQQIVSFPPEGYTLRWYETPLPAASSATVSASAFRSRASLQ